MVTPWLNLLDEGIQLAIFELQTEKHTMKKIFTAALLLSVSLSFAQNMKKEKMAVTYIQPPLVHLEEGMGYSSGN